MPPRIELIAPRQADLQGGKADYHVSAGEQIIGRIYQMHVTGPREHAMPRGDMKYPRISAELKKMGAVR